MWGNALPLSHITGPNFLIFNLKTIAKINPVISTPPPCHMALHLSRFISKLQCAMHIAFHITSHLKGSHFITPQHFQSIFLLPLPPSEGSIYYDLSNHYFKMYKMIIIAILGLSSWFMLQISCFLGGPFSNRKFWCLSNISFFILL